MTALCPPPPPVALVQQAQQAGLNNAGADKWYIDNQGRACVRNAFDASFDAGAPSSLRHGALSGGGVGSVWAARDHALVNPTLHRAARGADSS